jgi:hypothetical protein
VSTVCTTLFGYGLNEGVKNIYNVYFSAHT